MASANTTSDTITLTAQCHCRRLTFTSDPIPRSSLPLKGTNCHCNSCRHVTGSLRGSSDIVWPGPPPTNSDLLKKYAFSPRLNIFFCGHCSTTMFWEDNSTPGKTQHLVFTGVLNPVEQLKEGERLVQWEYHMFLEDTIDGGAVNWLSGLNGKGAEKPRRWLGWNEKSEEINREGYWPEDVKGLVGHGENLLDAEGDKENVLVKCHCGGVNLVLRAGEAQRDFKERQARGEKLPWFVDLESYKLLGSLDGCDDCRICSGVDLFAWTFAELKHISFADGKETLPTDTTTLKEAIGKDPRLGTLALYVSSEDVQRYACGRCSATVFYACDDRPDMVDIAAGLLHAPEGARAERVISWSWGGKLGFGTDMKGTWREHLAAMAEEETEQFRVARDFPKNFRRIVKEQGASAVPGGAGQV
ncbi:Mss4-like protein [Apiosordaria backusii]|uniref:Mss4-like protein n=1 Tax=Apiosordaria backusii TaxID=314023 RepID=A0AA40BJM9_9PEZI|nr:Mss4-like protein [Apiosordaria backusii]